MMLYASRTRPPIDSSTPTDRADLDSILLRHDHGDQRHTEHDDRHIDQKTEPHQNCSSSAAHDRTKHDADPNRAGPHTDGRPRSSGSKTFVMIANVAGMMAAAPMPISARAPMSWPGVWAYADNSDDAPNSKSPFITIRFGRNGPQAGQR
jgi:hypothetical protein